MTTAPATEARQMAEFVGIAAIVNVLSRTGRSEWIAASICAAVGLHSAPP